VNGRRLSPQKDMSHPLQSYDVFLEPVSRRIRVKFAGRIVADTCGALRFHERGHVPVYYVPAEDVREELLQPSGVSTFYAGKGRATYWDLKFGEYWSENAVWRYGESTTQLGARIRDYYAFDWRAVDVWYEEQEELFTHSHARDPYKRIDVLASGRHIRVIAGNEVIAESRHPIAAFETGVPVLYYLPRQDVRTDLLEPTSTLTHCPYKGTARYWSIRVGERTYNDAVWSYSAPFSEMWKVDGLLAFYPDRVDRYEVDGKVVRDEDWNLSVLDFLARGEFYAGQA
jgi:uncharacterized protein (DUF427 family)